MNFDPSISLHPKEAKCARINIFCIQESSWGQQNMLQVEHIRTCNLPILLIKYILAIKIYSRYF